MKHFLFTLITLSLIGFIVGVALLQNANPESVWFFCFLPLFILSLLWGAVLADEYHGD